MFDKRTDLVRLVAVAEAGKIGTAAERLAMTQPALTRVIARLERRLGARLFERLPGFLRRERFLDMTAGIVAWRGQALSRPPAAHGRCLPEATCRRAAIRRACQTA